MLDDIVIQNPGFIKNLINLARGFVPALRKLMNEKNRELHFCLFAHKNFLSDIIAW